MNTRRARRFQVGPDEGFTLIELLIVMSIMLILMTLAIPSAMRAIKSANQTSAVQSLRAIGSAEVSYNSAYPANGFSCSLAALGGAPGTAPTQQASQLLDPGLAIGNKSGYTFTIDKCTKVTVNNVDQFTGFQVNAVPNTVGRTGDRGFCMDESDIIKFDPTGGTNCTQTIQ